MKKKFNTTGVCFSQFHYMMNTSTKFKEVLNLIESGNYFTINRPRQYGKSTMLHLLTENLNKMEEYLPIALNFQGVDSKWHQSDAAFAQMFLLQLITFFEYSNSDIATFIKGEKISVTDMDTLSKFITRFVYKLDKKLVLLIDEVDASSDYLPFLNFLGVLRSKYLGRVYPHHATFHSVVLAGVLDIKSLKYKLRNPADAQNNSPWNIAIDFKVKMSFNPQEIAPMLEQYCTAESVTMDIPAIAERLYYHTSGYPFLVSRLCRIIVEEVLPLEKDKVNWNLDDVEASVQILLKENNTNFDSLIKNLEDHPDLYNLVSNIIMNGENVPFNQYNPMIHQGILYGIFKRNGRIRIHNRIYEQLVYDYMASRLLTDNRKDNIRLNYGGHFQIENNAIDMEAVLKQFQRFMKEQRSDKDKDFIERQWRLIFLAYLKPIINRSGHDFKEVEVSEEKRLDIVVTYYQHKYVLELKLWRGPKKHKAGVAQLADYLDIHGVDRGYLVIFDTLKKKSWTTKTISYKGKEIFAVWV